MTKVLNLRLPATPAQEIAFEEGKEALADALLNLTWVRVSGSGAEGAIVYGVKPSLRFVSGFLLPKFSEDRGGQSDDESSDIHISTHGLDCQIMAKAAGEPKVDAEFCIYVRALPSWAELIEARNELFPNPPLRPEVEQLIRSRMKDRLQQALDEEQKKPESERRARRLLQQDIYKALLADHGVEISAEGVVAEEEEGDGDSTEADEGKENFDGDDDGARAKHLKVLRGRYKFRADGAARELDVPQKWMRLPVRLEPLLIDLSSEVRRQQAMATWKANTVKAVRAAVEAWTKTRDGNDWAYRRAVIRPSHYASEAAWTAFLEVLRKTDPVVDDLVPALNGVQLTIELSDDLRDPQRRNLRVVLENNSNNVSSRRRHRFEHAIHQVALKLTLPHRIHQPLRLDRVEPSYRFSDFLTYPAIGINCGIGEAAAGDDIVLSTNWMPRYVQPRIVPTDIKGVRTDFASLGADGFDPKELLTIVSRYREWIDTERTTLDPTRGAASEEERQRERERFRVDLSRYAREADRIELGVKLLMASYAAYTANRSSKEAAPYRAWGYLNRTFAQAGKKRQITDWRLFQLAFILAHVPTIASRMPEFAKAPWFDPDFDEDTATLLYFPTGGGKSEAFFGLLVFNLFLDRLRGKLTGVTALIRYPLRLLTLQQAQRLLSIIVVAEVLRRAERLGGAPFEIGFWVGRGNTPNSPNDARLEPVPRRSDANYKDDTTTSDDYRVVNESFNKVPKCPVCGMPTGLRRIGPGEDAETGIFCFNDACDWNRKTDKSQLPLLIVDRDIYAHAPAILLGVIDKLALIGQYPTTINRVISMFGAARWRRKSTGHLVLPSLKDLKEGPAAHDCEPIAPAYRDGVEVFHDPFPSLVIQDEAHLLEESLGTFAGLFETMLEELFRRSADLLKDRVARSPFGAKPARLPKIIAATATVSVPEQQFGSLYQRKHMHFPYPGPTIYQSFYARPAVPANPARAGLGGGSARAPEIEAPWMRVYTSLMTNGKNHTVTTVSVLAAYHLAVSELWADVRDAGRRPAAVQRLIESLSAGDPLRAFHEAALLACASETDVLENLLDLFRISLTYVTNKKGGDQVIDAFREEVSKVHARHGRSLPQFHSDLISGGVDVAEIQDIMRRAEGTAKVSDEMQTLDDSLRNIVATSAISHGVDVDKFNAMFFAGMPSDIAEFIQASSRVGRTHAGFCLLIPTPHARRDRYIIETHDIFNRFLERMIAPPAITRWAASAHERVLTSMFQAWLSGWAEQMLFIEAASDAKIKAPAFMTVSDVNRLVTSTMPTAAKDFMEFSVKSIGVMGRGSAAIGAAPHQDYYDASIKDRANRLINEFRTLYDSTPLRDYWDNAVVGQKPMMSLRDIDEAGRFVATLPFNRGIKGAEARALVSDVLRIVRRQTGRVSELDSEDGEI